MHYEFDQELDKVASEDRPDILPAQKDSYIQKAITIWTKSRYGPHAGKGFETDQERISSLGNLHVKSPELQTVIVPTQLPNGDYEVELTTATNLLHEYYVLTRARVEIEQSGCTKTIRVDQIQTDDETTTFTKPNFLWGQVPARFGRSSANTDTQSIYFETNNLFTINNVWLDYLKKPDVVYADGYDHITGTSGPFTNSGTLFGNNAVNCDIDEIFHHEIISLAVSEVRSDLTDLQGTQLKQIRIKQDF